MSASIKTVLIIGGTSGIGEAFARRFHSQGKNVICTGRRQDRLKQLEQSLSGLKSYVMDNTDLPTLPGHVKSIMELFPDIDTVWINAGKGSMSSIKDISSISDDILMDEITTNVTGPMILARHFIPLLIVKDVPTTLMMTSSGMAFVPNPAYSIYASTKAFVHHFMVAVRASLQDTKVSVIEIVPPYISTDMQAQYKDKLSSLIPMSLGDFTDEVFEALDNGKADVLKEIAGGSAKPRVDAWRSGMGPVLMSGS